MPNVDFTLYDIICRNAANQPEEEAIVFKDQRLTFLEYKQKCDQLAAGLSERGIQIGDRLAVLANNSSDYLVLYGAAAKIGAIILAINWRSQPEEIEYILSDCTPRYLFIDEPYFKPIKESIRANQDVETVILLDSAGDTEEELRLDALFSEDVTNRFINISGTTPFVIMYTAAIEGNPRGAILSQGNCIASNSILIQEFGLSRTDSHVCLLPLFHVGGLHTTLAVMHAGGKNVILEKFDPKIALGAISDEAGTIFVNFAPILSSILDEHESSPADLSSLKHVYGLDHPETIKRFLDVAANARYYSSFAQTEAMSVSLAPMNDCPGSSGRPTILTQIRLFDDYDNEVPIGSPGEICIRSSTVFQGYWGLKEESSQTFRNGWHHTGDIGRFDENGFLWYVKRKAQKALIKPGGENVYPAEVEKALLEHSGIAEACVFGVADEKWGEAVKAVCVLKKDVVLDAVDLIEFVGTKIARYKKPKHIVYVDMLPTTSDGEVDREKVKKDHGGMY